MFNVETKQLNIKADKKHSKYYTFYNNVPSKQLCIQDPKYAALLN